MTLVLPEGFASIIHSLTWSGDPEPLAVTYGLAIDTVAVGSPNEIADAAATAFDDNLVPAMSSVLTLVQTEATVQYDPEPAPPSVGISTIGGVGAAAGNVVPQNTAYLFHKRTLFGGRGGRGRMYFPGVQEGEVDNIGNVDPTQVTGLNTVLQAFLLDLVSAAFIDGMVVLHDSAGAFAAEPPYVVTSLTCDARVSTQRRRLRR